MPIDGTLLFTGRTARRTEKGHPTLTRLSQLVSLHPIHPDSSLLRAYGSCAHLALSSSRLTSGGSAFQNRLWAPSASYRAISSRHSPCYRWDRRLARTLADAMKTAPLIILGVNAGSISWQWTYASYLNSSSSTLFMECLRCSPPAFSLSIIFTITAHPPLAPPSYPYDRQVGRHARGFDGCDDWARSSRCC